MNNNAKKTIEKLLSSANVNINGSQPSDIQCYDERLYHRILRKRELGLGESYMDKWWDTDRLDDFIYKILSANLRQKTRVSKEMIQSYLISLLLNPQTARRASRNASHHYDIGNDLYERMLDKYMVYSCGYWKQASNLDEAQIGKMDLICRKLRLQKGMLLLDIGCGWGGFAEYAARQYGATVTGISPALEQVKLAQKRVQGLPVTILQKDYRELSGTFDRIVSIGMLEHVGPRNYPTFFKICQKLLNQQGMMLHQMIGGNRPSSFVDPWIDKYIFPGGAIPSLSQISKASENRFIIEDVHNFGPDYDKTLMAWHANFKKHYPEICDHYDERFYRMWCYYLLSCAGAFRARQLQLWQIVMRPIGVSAPYTVVR